MLPSIGGVRGEPACKHLKLCDSRLHWGVHTLTESVWKPERERLQTPAAATALFGKRNIPPFDLRSVVLSSAISSTCGQEGCQPSHPRQELEEVIQISHICPLGLL